MTTPYEKPPALRPGDKVRVVAPGMAFAPADFEKGERVLSKRYRVVFDDAIFSRRRYLAGDDALRLSELERG